MRNFKIILLPIYFLASLATTAQSPYLSVNVSMESINAAGINYQVEMKICTPVKTTERGDWFSHDTSAIDFGNLQKDDVDCGQFLTNGEGIEVLSGDKTFAKYNAYEYGDQVFAWEKLLVFRISNQSTAAMEPDMYIVLPVRYKSFVTYITLTAITFQPGKIIMLDKPDAVYKKNSLTIKVDMHDEKGIAAKGIDWIK